MIKHITVHLTSSCNLKCENCHVDAYFGREQEQLIDRTILGNLFVPSLESISIAGGEPFNVKEKLYDFIDCIPKHIKSVAVTTNGLLLTESDFEKLYDRNVRLQFSVDGTDSLHEANRGSHTYINTIENIKKAIAKGIRVDILTTVSYMNMDSIKPFLIEMDSYGVSNITLLHFTPKGRGAYKPELEVSKKDWIYFCQKMRIELNDLNAHIWIQPRYLTRRQIQQVKETRDVHVCNCYRYEYAYIDINSGEVYPCGLAYHTPLGIGNIKDKSLQELADEAILKCITPAECEKCTDLELCKGGARCYAWLWDEDLTKKDPHCSKDSFFPICPFPAVQIAGAQMTTKRPTIV